MKMRGFNSWRSDETSGNRSVDGAEPSDDGETRESPRASVVLERNVQCFEEVGNVIGDQDREAM